MSAMQFPYGTFESPNFDELLKRWFPLLAPHPLMNAKIDAIKSYFTPMDHAYLCDKRMDRINKGAMWMRLVGPLIMMSEVEGKTRIASAVQAMKEMGAFSSYKARAILLEITEEGREHLDSFGAKKCHLDQAIWVQAMQVLEYLVRQSMGLERIEENGFSYYVLTINEQDVENQIEWLMM